MKTKLLLLVLFLLSIIPNSFSQPYAPLLNNSTWNVTVYNFTSSQNLTIGPGSDVIIGSYAYRKITDPIFGDDVYLREDVAAKKVYRRRNNVDELLFDFSLPINGTFTTPNGVAYTLYSITSVIVNGGTRRKFNLNNGIFNLTWIEGVGNTEDPLKPDYELPSDPVIFLGCSAQNGIAVYNAGLANGGAPIDCSMLSLNQNQIKQNIVYAPNPFSNELQIVSEISLENITLKIFNSLGQLVKEDKNINGLNFTLHRDNLKEGLYLIQLLKDNKIISNKKVIVED